MPAKKSPSKSTKATAAKPAVVKKAAPKAASKAAKKAVPAVKKASAKASKGTGKSAPKATKAKPAPESKNGTAGAPVSKTEEAIRTAQKNHKHAKAQPLRSSYILFTIQDARDILLKRAKEEKIVAPKKTKSSAPKVARVEPAKVEEAPRQAARHGAASLEDILGLSGFSKSAQEKKVPRKFEKYHRLLLELRDEVRAELNLHSNDTLKRSSKDDAGDIAISVDAGTDNFDRDFALSLLSSEQDALNEIEAAIQRIYNGTYGICEETGEPISDERLEAVPFTRFSVEGQKAYEASARRRVSRAGAFLNEDNGEKISFGDEDGDS